MELLASGVTLTGSAVASNSARIDGMMGHKLTVIYTPGVDSTNALNLTIETSDDDDLVTDANAKWSVLENWTSSSGTITKTNYLLSIDSSGVTAQTADLLFNKPAQRIRVKYSETNAPTPYGTISVRLTSSPEPVIPNISSPLGTVTVDSEMPAAAALADATANPTTPSLGSLGFSFNGTTWDRNKSVNTGQQVVTPKDSSGNSMPAMDAVGRPGFQKITDGTNTMPTADAVARALYAIVLASMETGTMYNGTTALTPKFAAIAASTSGDNTLVAAVASKKIRVLAMALVAGAAGNIYFTSAAAGTVIFGGSTNKIQLAANGGFVLPFCQVGWFENSSVNQALIMNASSTGPFSGGLVYVEV